MARNSKDTNKKRHGRHHHQGKHYIKVYWPYIPSALALALVVGLFWVQPKPPANVLAYATDLSTAGLLSETNQKRTSSGVSSLALSNKLAQAAQTKAEDMVTRDYWAHTTPEGKAPWTFIEASGYDYQKAGENLAYGFASSKDTVAGWMNSPTHKANLMDKDYTEVGFGYANAPDFQQDGPETVVVAMYGRPQVKAAVTSQPTVKPKPKQVAEQVNSNASSPEPKSVASPTPVTTAAALIEPPTRQIALIETLTGGQFPWALLALGLLAGGTISVMLVRHSLKLRHLLRNSEKFILHHPIIDTGLILIVLVSIILSRGVGFIR